MATKRQLKKRISYVCGVLAGEFLNAATCIESINDDTVCKVINDIAHLQVTTRGLVTVAYDKTPRDFGTRHQYNRDRRAYYKKAYGSLRDEFGKKALEIVKEMNAAVPAEERSKLKAD